MGLFDREEDDDEVIDDNVEIEETEEDEDPFDLLDEDDSGEDEDDEEFAVTVDSSSFGDPDPIGGELHGLDRIDGQPGVPNDIFETEDKIKKSGTMITLRGMNDDVKEFTDSIKERRMREEESGKYRISEFVYDVEAVRIFGQYSASASDMAAYFRVDESTINKLIKDTESDFHQVYSTARSVLRIALRQKQIKVALDGDVAMLKHLGKYELEQHDNVSTVPLGSEFANDKGKRRRKITQLVQTIEEFDD